MSEGRERSPRAQPRKGHRQGLHYVAQRAICLATYTESVSVWVCVGGGEARSLPSTFKPLGPAVGSATGVGFA